MQVAPSSHIVAGEAADVSWERVASSSFGARKSSARASERASEKKERSAPQRQASGLAFRIFLFKFSCQSGCVASERTEEARK